MKNRRKPRKGDIFVSRDSRRRGLTIQVQTAHRDGTCTVKNDLGRVYRVLTRRLNGHGHWRLVEAAAPLEMVVPTYWS